jgi:hypothetical protein
MTAATALILSGCAGSPSATQADRDACAVLRDVSSSLGVDAGPDPLAAAEKFGDLSDQLDGAFRSADDEDLRMALLTASVELPASLVRGMGGGTAEESLAPFYEAMDEAGQRCTALGATK